VKIVKIVELGEIAVENDDDDDDLEPELIIQSSTYSPMVVE
jgi:hypothetical protein